MGGMVSQRRKISTRPISRISYPDTRRAIDYMANYTSILSRLYETPPSVTQIQYA
jgi:hypothetical protein